MGITARSPGLPQDRPVSGFSDVIDLEGFIVRLAFSRLVDQKRIGKNNSYFLRGKWHECAAPDPLVTWMKKSGLPGNGEDHFGMVPVGGIWKNKNF